MQKRSFSGSKKSPQTTNTRETSAAILPTKPTTFQSHGEMLPASSAQPRNYQQRTNWQSTQQQLRCLYCGYCRIESFDSVYARQSSLSKYKRGLFIKTGWSQPHRQSFLAMRCAPPKKKNIWWGIGLAVVALAVLRYIPPAFVVFLIPSTLVAFILLAFGILASGYGMYWNRAVYPGTRETWENSFYCSRCGKVTVIQPQN